MKSESHRQAQCLATLIRCYSDNIAEEIFSPVSELSASPDKLLWRLRACDLPPILE